MICCLRSKSSNLANSKDNNFNYSDNFVHRCNPYKLEYLPNFILIISNRILVQREHQTQQK